MPGVARHSVWLVVLLAAVLYVASLGAAVAQQWRAHTVPLFVSASHPMGHQGFVRVVNRSDVPGEVRIDAVDDAEVPYGPVTLRIEAGETVHFNSGDLEEGNAAKGLSRGTGSGTGNWRLRLRSTLELDVLAYNRTEDGLLAGLHDVVERSVVSRPETNEEAMGHRVVIFNPASNHAQVSRLRILNPGAQSAMIAIEGIDDDGETPGTAVEFEVLAGASRTVSSVELESGEGEGLNGQLGDGKGKWRLVVTSDVPVEVMSLLSSPTGHLTNLSTSPGADNVHQVPLFARAGHPLGYQGFVRIINGTDGAGEVSIEAFDDEGAVYGPVTLGLEANETVHFNSRDLEEGNAAKGLSGGIGEGAGDWRLRLRSDLALDVLAYNRTQDGMLTSLHDVVPLGETLLPDGTRVQGHEVATFNPASNRAQVSRLRILNPGVETAKVTIAGIDDDGETAGSVVDLEVAPGAARMVTAQALEEGQWAPGEATSGALGDGKGKWRLVVTSDETVQVMGLMSTPTGHLVNLSTPARQGIPVPSPATLAEAALEVSGKTTASIATPVVLRVRATGAPAAIERYEWYVSDGQRASGEEVSVRFAEAGLHTGGSAGNARHRRGGRSGVGSGGVRRRLRGQSRVRGHPVGVRRCESGRSLRLAGSRCSRAVVGVVSRFVSWNPHGNSPVCSVDELPGMTKQSEKRSKPVPSPFS